MGGGRVMAISVFLSTVSDEFRAYRDQLVHDLTRHNVAVKVQEDFKDLGGSMLDKLDAYVAHCDAIVHLVGDMCGATADESQQQALVAKYADLPNKLPPLCEALKNGFRPSYTQWEAWLALYHGKPLLIAKAKTTALRGPKYMPDHATRAAQVEHLHRLKAFHRYPGSEFGSPDELAKQIAYSAILDLLVADYAQKQVRKRDVAEGFIEEMARRVAGDKALDLDGMKQAVRNAIEIYEREIAGRPVESNFDEIVDRALTRAKEQVDKGQSALARSTLRRAAEEMRRDEKERRERYVAGVTTLYHRERDIALAAYDGDGAAMAVVELARTVCGADGAKVGELLGSEAQSLYEDGRDRGSNVHLVAAIASRRLQLRLVSSSDERGAVLNDLGLALWKLGERESGTARLEDAVAAYRSALKARTRERDPLDWAMTQNNLGLALWRLGERESGTARLEDSVAACRSALEERTRELVPLDWAMTQNNLGLALWRLGERESGTARLEEAVAAYRAALQEQTRERAPLERAQTQNNLGLALFVLGARESGTARLEEAVAAYRAAFHDRTRERVPLDWAMTQNNLGNALVGLGERESGTGKLEEAVQAYRAALKENTRERVPLEWAMTKNNLGLALWRLGERERRTARLEEAVAAYRAALQEYTRERVPLQWAQTQHNLGLVLWRLGERESGTTRLEEAVAAYSAALEEMTRERVPLQWASAQNNLGNVLLSFGERESGPARLEQAVAAYRAALQEWTRERAPLEWAQTQNNLGNVFQTLGQRENGNAWLEEAVSAYRTALQWRTRERVPLDWAATQHNLGNALRSLGERRGGTVRLKEAVNAYSEALQEYTREGVPLQWAASFGSQGVAMTLIAESARDGALAESAVMQIAAAYETLRDGGHQQWASVLLAQLAKAQAIHDRLTSK
jgi:tetratricopeptide (TPR) repeat protein